MGAYILAVAGKGGTGKTTICGMLIDWLCRNGKPPVLAVDADAISNLNEVLGVEVEHTLGEIREMIATADQAEENPIPASMSKKEFMDAKFHTALIEEDERFDLRRPFAQQRDQRRVGFIEKDDLAIGIIHQMAKVLRRFVRRERDRDVAAVRRAEIRRDPGGGVGRNDRRVDAVLAVLGKIAA